MGGRGAGVQVDLLGVRGWASAICLGIAMGFQPMAWFIAPFLVLGLLVVRAGDLRPGGRCGSRSGTAPSPPAFSSRRTCPS